MGMQISEGSLRGGRGRVKMGCEILSLDFWDVLLTGKQGGVLNDLRGACLSYYLRACAAPRLCVELR